MNRFQRQPANTAASRRQYKNRANKTHALNQRYSQRGGIRL